MRNYKKYSVLILAVAVLVICAIAIQKVQAKVIFHEIISWDLLLTNNSCLPEETVMVTGLLSILETETIDKDGKVHYTLHKRPVDIQLFSVDAEGQPVGEPWPYQAVGITQEASTVDPVPLDVVEVYQNNFFLIGKGDLPNYKVQMNYSLMVELDEEGEMVFDFKVLNINVTCN